MLGSLLLKIVLFVSANIKEDKSNVSRWAAKFEARKKVTMPLNNRNDPLSIIKIEIIVIPMGRFIFIRIFFNTWIYKYIISKVSNLY